MDKLDKDFDKETDLSSDFDNESDMSQQMRDAGINPDAPGAAQMMANRMPTKGPIDTGQRDALARGMGKGVTLGMQAPLAGLGAAATQAVTGNQGPVQGRNLDALMAAYQEMKNQEIAKNAAAQKAYPKTFGAGQLAGSLPTAIGTAGAAPSIGTLAAQGALAGAGNYVGSNPNPTVAGTVGNAAVGGALGAAIPAGIGAASKALPGALNKMRGVMSQTMDTAGDLAPQMLQSGTSPEGMQSFGPSQMTGQQSPSGLAKFLPKNMQEQMQAGKEGINTSSPEANQKILPEEANKSSDYLTKKIMDTHQELMDDINSSLDSATKGGKSLDYSSPQPEDMSADQDQIDNLDDYEDPNPNKEDEPVSSQPEVKESPFFKAFDDLEDLSKRVRSYNDSNTKDGQMADKLFAKITKMPREGNVDEEGMPLIETRDGVDKYDYTTQLSPKETKNLMDDVYTYSGVLYKNDQPELGKIAYNFYKGLRDRLRAEVPEYAEAADRMNQFQQYIPETLMANGNNAIDAGTRLSKSNSKYLDIKNPTQDLISNLAKDGTSTYPAKQTYNQLESSLDTLSTLEKARQSAAELDGKPFESVFEKLGMNEEQILKFLRDKAVRARAYDQMKTGNIPLNPTSVQKMTGFIKEHSDVLSNKVGNLMSNAPQDVLYAASEKLSRNPAVAALGAGLKSAIASGDIVKQNAAIFAILQNPTAKSIIDPDIKSDEKRQANVPKRSPYNTEF
jgi:hypothetical protein